MTDYDFKTIEAKWQKVWEDEDYGIAADFSDKPKHYNLIEFPYPSGTGLHVGHCMGQGASDAYCRMKRMQGFNVMYPIGWDAFGLPTENFAIKNKQKPQVVAANAIENFRRQMKSMGFAFDWSREVNTTDPNYYKWTQWIFLQFYKHGYVDSKLVEIDDTDRTSPRMAYQAEMPVNWCPSCKIVLANEEVVAGACERCGTIVEKRNQKQWMLRITAYADRLIKDLDTVDYLQQIKTQQINWIGKSVGAEIDFKIKDSSDTIRVFTTRADTLFGCTYVVLAPENTLIDKLKSQISNLDNVEAYISKAKNKTDIERTEIAKDKTGVELKGIKAVNPINNEEVSVWVADYVLTNYGTGAVMAVPAHDDRDFEFAKKYNIDIRQVITPEIIYHKTPPQEGKPWVERNAIEAIIYNPKNDSYLCLKWKKQPWTTFITGGVENGEDLIEAAKREILEETGYKNVKFIKKLGITRPKFFAAHKDENRIAYFNGMYFQLINDTKIDITQEEKDRYDIVWMKRSEITSESMICASIDYWLRSLDNKEQAFTDYGFLVASGEFNGLTSEEAKNRITEHLKEANLGDFTTNYKLRDWIFSRQHYWGEPIPIIHCEKCGAVPVPENQLPIELPDVENYEPTDSGESPLSKIESWVNVKCPVCDGMAKRETDTMPNWAGSSWYYLRYCDNRNDKELANFDKLKYWTPVDLYNGGPEHITLHLLYSRFWHKFLYDLNVVPTAEPYQKRIQHGIILGPDGQKMSKSKGNVINPDEMVANFGADTLRAYIMFIGPYDKESAWSNSNIQGVHRFLKRLWLNFDKVKSTQDTDDILVKLNQTVESITSDLENFRLNTIISGLMELNNLIEKVDSISPESFKIFLQLLYPVCPHVASELWQKLGENKNIEASSWPVADKNYLISSTIEIAVQVNGKTKSIITVDSKATQAQVEEIAINDTKIKMNLVDRKIIKTIYVPNKIVNFVIL